MESLRTIRQYFTTNAATNSGINGGMNNVPNVGEVSNLADVKCTEVIPPPQYIRSFRS